MLKKNSIAIFHQTASTAANSQFEYLVYVLTDSGRKIKIQILKKIHDSFTSAIHWDNGDIFTIHEKELKPIEGKLAKVLYS